MKRRFVNPISVPAALLFFSSIPIIIALVEVIQIPTGTLPDDAAHLRAVPIVHFAHVAAGATFGLLGPIQFGRVLAKRYGRLHRIMGRVFVLAGAFLALSSLSLWVTFPNPNDPFTSASRFIFGIALGVALIIAMQAIRVRNIHRHRDWMIRSYAIGIGATAVSFVMFPIYIITGTPPSGLIADLIFAGAWIASIGVGEFVIRHLNHPKHLGVPS